MKRALFLLSFCLLAGCGDKSWSSKPEVIIEPPANWQTFENQVVTLEGSAGNSPIGPILRFTDGSVIGLQGFRLWGIDAVGRPVGIKGTVVRGSGARADSYVINVTEWYLQKSTNVPKKPE
jgi:hypothetical protein